jgi:hypothetical protein
MEPCHRLQSRLLLLLRPRDRHRLGTWPPYYPAGFTPLFHHERLDAPANTPVPARARRRTLRIRPRVRLLHGRPVRRLGAAGMDRSGGGFHRGEPAVGVPVPDEVPAALRPPTALPASGWIGASVDEQHRAEPTLAAMRKVSGVKVKWLSLEPLLEPIQFSSLEGIDWIVIGAQSENVGQNPAFAPQFEWVADLVATARRDGCKVWLKTNLLGQVSGQWPGMQMIQEVPV